MNRFAGSAATVAVAALLLAGCSGGSSDAMVSGTVVSVSGADVSLLDSNGDKVAEVRSDLTGAFESEVPDDAEFPLTIVSKGGLNLATNQQNGFGLVGISFSEESEDVVVSPIGTLAMWMAECSGEVSEHSVDAAWPILHSRLGIGFGEITDPMHHDITAENAALIVLGNAVLAESVSRTVAALSTTGQTTSADDVMQQIACDLQHDGDLNGVGEGSNDRLAATYRAAETSVLIEAIAGQIHIDGRNASAELQGAIDALVGEGRALLADLAFSAEVIDRARDTLSLFLVQLPDEELLRLAVALEGDAAEVADRLAAALDPAGLTTLWGMAERVALTDGSELTELVGRMEEQAVAGEPTVSLAASSTLIEVQASIRLSWASADAERCFAHGGWGGEVDLQGSVAIDGISSSTDFGLECVGLGGIASDDIHVAVVGADAGGSTGADGPDGGGEAGEDPAPSHNVPEVNLSAARTVVAPGEATTLVWAGSDADYCEAGGDWSGIRDVSGSESTGPVDGTRTYVLTCHGGGGSGEATVTVESSASAPPEPPPPPEPSVSLTASDQAVSSGALVTLSWSSADASTCAAEGGWSGGKGTEGSEVVGPLIASTTYSLTCTGGGGSAIAMLSVEVTGSISVSWQAPIENVDGSPIADLAGYKIYYGLESGVYAESVQVDDPEATSHTVVLPGATYYVAMTALSGDGQESGHSNEVMKSTNP